MQIWNELVSTALIGTQRERPQAFVVDGPLAKIADTIAGSGLSSETNILRLAAAIELYRRAGRLMRGANVIVTEPCGERSSSQPCSKEAAAHLSTLMKQENEALLAEWLFAARNLGKSVPSILLPPLLELGRTKSTLAKIIAAQSDGRINWLAEMNADWHYAINRQPQIDAHALTELWETGETIDRVVALRALRSAQPDAARELLLSTWSQDPPELKTKFLEELRCNLSQADEPFLEERALDDKRKEVRAQAVELLKLLPESRLYRRMLARVDACVEVSAKTIEVALPPDCDQSMVRDGIVKSRASLMGEKADWVAQMIGYINPSHWEQQTGMTPGQLVLAANASQDWRSVLLSGWQTGAVTHLSSAWAVELIPDTSFDVQGLIACLTAAQKEQILRQSMLPGSELKDGFPLVLEVAQRVFRGEEIPGMLSAATSRALIATCKEAAPGSSTSTYLNPVVALLPSLALRLHLDVIDESLSGWPEWFGQQDYSAKVMDQFMYTIQFRKELNKALKG